MESRRPQRNISVAVLTIAHAILAAVLGLAACALVLSGATGGAAFVESLHDPAIAVALSLTVASLLAAGAGISAFILLSVERAEAAAVHARRSSP